MSTPTASPADIGPKFVDLQGNALPFKPPFSLEGMTARVFPLRANLDSLRRFCDSYLNIVPAEVGYFRPALPYVYLMMLDYGRLTAGQTNIGWFAQREVFFLVPVHWFYRVGDRWVFKDWATVAPYIFVDDDFSVPLGRTVYGWPKAIAKLTPTASAWMKDARSPITEATLSTRVFPEIYQGKSLEDRVFMQVQHERTTLGIEYPFNARSPVAPWSIGWNAARTAVGLGQDWLGILGSFGVFPIREGATPSNFGAMTRRALQIGFPLRPDLLVNTINVKQFRATGKPTCYCYQALTNGPLRFTSINGAGLLGAERMLLGDASGGYSILMHEWPSHPIVGTLGLEIESRWAGDGASVVELKPVLPLWYDCNMKFLAATNLAWRNSDGIWRNARGDPQPSQVPTRPVSADQKLFNTTLGSSQNSVAGPFQFSGTTIRVLPLLARRAKLQKYIATFFNEPLKDEDEYFELWSMPRNPAPSTELSSDATTRSEHGLTSGRSREEEVSYVYLTATSFGDVTSKTNNIGDWADFELTFLIPVKRMRRRNGGRELIGVGVVPAYTFVNDTTAAAARSEVLGIDTTRATFIQPENAWMSADGSMSGGIQMLLRVNAEVLPALGEGQQSRRQTIVDVTAGRTSEGIDGLPGRVRPDRWAALLRGELARKNAAKNTSKGELDIGRAMALELMQHHLPISLYTMKQFRDACDPDRACYQAVVRVARVLDEIHDLRETEDPVVVRLHEFPTYSIVETLGLEGTTIRDDGAGIVYDIHPVRPFSLRVTMSEELGESIMERSGALPWKAGRENRCTPALEDDATFHCGRDTTRAQDRGDARRLERRPRPSERHPFKVSDVRRALNAIEPQLVIESILSREWGNWDENARWRVGRRYMADRHAREIVGVDAAHLPSVEAAINQTFFEHNDNRPGRPTLDDAGNIRDRCTDFAKLIAKIDAQLTQMVAWGAEREYGFLEAEKQPSRAKPEEIELAAQQFLDSADSIASLAIVGEVESPGGAGVSAADDNSARLLFTVHLGRTQWNRLRPQVYNPDKGSFEFNRAAEDLWKLRSLAREIAELAHRRQWLQREALFNKLSRAWQKPDYCVRRDSAGPDVERLFPMSGSWDYQWYDGLVSKEQETAKATASS